ncbi:MAG: DUF1284 domain-containing protein [Deltaproteobacteria bacterium]|nr:MAG: DUF1284 domain-containing protein [Deltaproteobacteria bacterium]
MMVRFRPHHFICLHFYSGEGYSPEFVEKLASLVEEAERGDVEVVFGADDLCRVCPYLEEGVCRYEEDVARLDGKAMELLSLEEGGRKSFAGVRGEFPRILPLWKEFACSSCAWREVCERHPLYR